MTNGAELKMRRTPGDSVRVGGVFQVECHDKHGNKKWADTFHNYVTDTGLDHMLKLLDNSTTIITTWYIGLLATTDDGGVTDTAVMTNISEATEYSNTGGAGSGTRQIWTQALTAATRPTLSNTGNLATFTINAANTTIGGAFITSSKVPGNTNGKLFSGGDFTGGKKDANAEDVLTVTYTLTGRDQSVV